MRRLAVGMAIFSIAIGAVSWARADDKDIAQKITAKLKQEQDAGNLWGFDINLQVGQGTVVLKGYVASQEQQQLALDAARDVTGVKNVVDELQIQATARSTNAQAETAAATPADDDTVAAAVAEKLAALKASGQLQDFRIGVEVKNGRADLNGTVTSPEQKTLALDTARTTPGVRDVVDQLKVVAATAPTTLAKVSSSAAADAASKTPAASYPNPTVPQLEPQPLEMTPSETTRGKISKANSPSMPAAVATPKAADPIAVRTERDAAASHASPTPVENAIYRHEGEDKTVSDQQIGASLMQQLQEAKQGGQLRGFGIGVHVEEGLVRLTGRVSSPEQEQLALDVARRTAGVREVINELTVSEPVKVAESAEAKQDLHDLSLEIAQTFGQRLQEQEAQGRLNGCEFDVKVDQAEIRLAGVVGSAEQQRLVLQVARSVPGVRKVEGDLRISASAPPQLAATPVSVSRTADQVPAYSPQEMSAPGCDPYTGGAMPSGGMIMDQTPRPLGPVRSAARAGAAIVAAPLALLHHPQAGGGGGAYMGGGAGMAGGGYGGDMYGGGGGGGAPGYLPGGVVPARYDHPNLPGYAWPSYAAYPNYAAVTYPKQYSPTAWPYIGPFYPYPQVPLGWRKVTLKWDDGWWQLNFKSK